MLDEKCLAKFAYPMAEPLSGALDSARQIPIDMKGKGKADVSQPPAISTPEDSQSLAGDSMRSRLRSHTNRSMGPSPTASPSRGRGRGGRGGALGCPVTNGGPGYRGVVACMGGTSRAGWGSRVCGIEKDSPCSPGRGGTTGVLGHMWRSHRGRQSASEVTAVYMANLTACEDRCRDSH